ncbi:MAG: hypothetical protein E6J67_18950 [Deltaproteobacteria bacterium]|nr:MAG: hypothetical protein E6J67_18950 [Deltaproteobacteria bacterium]
MRQRSVLFHLVAGTLVACSSGHREAGDSGPELALTAAPAAVFVGERIQLTAVFAGESASIDGIGPVQSGIPVETPPLSRTTTFTVRVDRGDEHLEARATVQASYRNRIRALANAPTAHTNHVATALPDGHAIVMGGNTSAALSVPDSTRSQIFDPASEAFTSGPDLLFSAEAQEFTSIAPLRSGGFLLVGTGINGAGGQLHPVITQVFDFAAASFSRVGDAATRGTSHRTATPLSDGGVLLSGGFGRTVTGLSDVAERYDANAAQWRTVGSMLHVRVGHTATLLRDGRMLIAGGLTCCQEPNPSPEFWASTAEIYDPATDAFTATGSMIAGRGLHAAALLPDGRVLISGGDGNDPAPFPLGTEIFDPATGQFSASGDLQAPRDSHSAVSLTDGRVLVIGGERPPDLAGRVGVGVPATEIFDPATARWSAGPMLGAAFYAATVTMLSNGKVLIFGGQDAGGFPQSAAALFE